MTERITSNRSEKLLPRGDEPWHSLSFKNPVLRGDLDHEQSDLSFRLINTVWHHRIETATDARKFADKFSYNIQIAPIIVQRKFVFDFVSSMYCNGYFEAGNEMMQQMHLDDEQQKDLLRLVALDAMEEQHPDPDGVMTCTYVGSVQKALESYPRT